MPLFMDHWAARDCKLTWQVRSMQSELMKLGIIYWTSDDCDRQVDLKLHLSVGLEAILFPYFDHCFMSTFIWTAMYL